MQSAAQGCRFELIVRWGLPSPLRGEGARRADEGFSGTARCRVPRARCIAATERRLRHLTPHPAAKARRRLAKLAGLSPEGRGGANCVRRRVRAPRSVGEGAIAGMASAGRPGGLTPGASGRPHPPPFGGTFPRCRRGRAQTAGNAGVLSPTPVRPSPGRKSPARGPWSVRWGCRRQWGRRWPCRRSDRASGRRP